MSNDTSAWHAELAWVGGERMERDVLIEARNGRIVAVTPNSAPTADAQRLPGLTMPGLVNTHSHVFHRAIRGHSQSGVADFWAWRDLMYAVAARLNPETLYRLARATYAEMALSGITSVGEFHYLHHDDGGQRYTDPNELSHAVIQAAVDAGIRITLLDTCYLQGDVTGRPLAGVQRRFDDGSFQGWAERVDALRPSSPLARVGSAIHSVRAVPQPALRPMAEFAAVRDLPLHVHLSEQPAENQACMAYYNCTPTELLADAGVWSPRATAVHATHLTEADIAVLGESRTSISMCCTTERDLADGVGPAIRLRAAGSPLCVGSDAHMAIDLWEEGRAIELNERLVSGIRGHLSAPAIAAALTHSGAASIGWDAGRIQSGALADLVTVALDTPRTAGARSGDALAHVLFAATAADIHTVIVDGREIVRDGCHAGLPEIGRELEDAVAGALGRDRDPA
ncbi:MAG: formimidoylglutamate deiminase [Microlunatus sp.]|nr:formimidoylglutamate deiminase [Microlunatus sp.]